MSLSRALSRREKVLMILLAVLLLFALYFFTVDRPVRETLDRVRAESEELSTQITVLQVKNARMQAMQKELDAILAQPNAAQVPSYDNLEQVMVFLNTVLTSADDYTLSFQGLSAGEDSGILRRGMSLSFTCSSYELARNMVQQLQDCPYRCQLKELSIAPAKADSTKSGAQPPLTSGAVTVTLGVTFFESRTAS